jgi:hypothetical protein
MIGELIDGKADIGASPLFLTANRVDVIDYLICTSQTRSKFVFRSPKLSFTENVFLLPFDKFVWGSLLAMACIAGLVLYFSMFVVWRMAESEGRPSLGESMRCVTTGCLTFSPSFQSPPSSSSTAP